MKLTTHLSITDIYSALAVCQVLWNTEAIRRFVQKQYEVDLATAVPKITASRVRPEWGGVL